MLVAGCGGAAVSPPGESIGESAAVPLAPGPPGYDLELTALGLELSNLRRGVVLANAGDLDGDGCTELAVAMHEHLLLSLHEGSPDGPKRAPSWQMEDGPMAEFAIAAVADVLGLGEPQLAVAASDVRTNPETTLPSWLRLYADSEAGLTLRSEIPLPPRAGPPRLVPVGDIDGDGHADLVLGLPRTGEDGGEVKLLLGAPGGFASEPAWSIAGGQGELLGDSLLALTDGDGRVAALAVGGVDRVVVVPITASGTGEPILLTDDADSRLSVRSVAAADMDGDGDVEILVTWDERPVAAPPKGRLQAWTWRGDSLERAERFDRTTGYGVTLAVADLDDDGRDDLVIGAPIASPHLASEGALELLLSGGSTLRARGGALGALLGSAMAVGDFDCDGRDDLVVSAPHHPGPVDSRAGPPGEVYLLGRLGGR